MHRTESEQILERLAISSMVCEFHCAVKTAPQSFHHCGHRLNLCFRTLKETTIASKNFRLAVACHSAESFICEDERIASGAHVAHTNRDRHVFNVTCQREDPLSNIGRPIVAWPDQVRVTA